MNFETWVVDLSSLSAAHPSGFRVVVEGDPTSPMGVHPGKFPDGLTAMQQARLLRCGLAAIISQAQNQGWEQEKTRFAERTQVVPTVVHQSNRPILSLKK